SEDEADALGRPEFLRVSMNGQRDLERIRTAHKVEGPLQSFMRKYYRLINGMDQAVGEIRNELKKRGLGDNTIIIFYSDNGHFMEEHGFTGKWLMYEESLRVPGFIYDPRNIRNGERSKEMVLNIDLAPTILDFAGI
ncbi:MAG: sulfatase-like hydrolase/transferase, partial [Bacteroidetes bacterium]|nr:sulfatase-like hydrolase/transferase [Bacteroidota bacterium]